MMIKSKLPLFTKVGIAAPFGSWKFLSRARWNVVDNRNYELLNYIQVQTKNYRTETF